MDIGTAKPSSEERALVSHHLIDVVDPDEDFSLARYQEMAYEAVSDIQRRGKLALLVGGSGLYVMAVIGGWHIPRVAPDPQLRHNLEARAAREGHMALYQELKQVDPDAARRIDPRNLRRLIRALEVCRISGMPFSQLQRSKPFFRTLVIGLTTARDDIYRKIDSRVDWMMERGLVQEVEGLIKRGYSLDLPSMSGLGYKQIGLYLQGRIDLPQAVQQIKFETHRFARHQYAWFRLKDERIHWFDIRDDIEAPIRNLIHEFASSDLGRKRMKNEIR
jgi:tRNA dimethylallyltransferase